MSALLVSASSLIAQAMPWPHAVYQHPLKAALVIRDLQHNVELEISYEDLTTIESASSHFWSQLDFYRTLIAAWHGNHRIIWS